jgi:hypothetical protein
VTNALAITRVVTKAAEPGRPCDECAGTGMSPLRLLMAWLDEIRQAIGPERDVLWRVYAELITDRFAFCESCAQIVYNLTKKELHREGAWWVQ